MLVIHEPEIKRTSTGARLQVEYDLNGKTEVLWYEVSLEYGYYLTIERTDAFVVALLSKAIQDGYDIKVKGCLSERLYYTLNKYLIPVLASTLKGKQIEVHCLNITSEPVISSTAVGTGLSCGVDSFSTIYEHIKNDCPPGYKITHVTFFNVGSHGSHGGEKARDLFYKRLKMVKKCAIELGKDLIVIDSNLSELLQMGFAELHTIRNMSAVLVLQKLFNVYYYASSVPLENFTLNKSMGSYDTFSLQMLSTESVSFFSSGTTLTRFDKTKMITHMDLVKKYLNVCIKSGHNCGKCIKCLRTLLTLEVLGEIENFKKVFNLNEYYKRKRRYMISVVARRKLSNFKQEIYEEMKKSQFKIPVHLQMIGRVAYIKIKAAMIMKDVKSSVYRGG